MSGKHTAAVSTNKGSTARGIRCSFRPATLLFLQIEAAFRYHLVGVTSITMEQCWNMQEWCTCRAPANVAEYTREHL